MKHLGRWTMLLSVGVTLFVGNVIAAMTDQIDDRTDPGLRGGHQFVRWTAG